MTTLSTHDTKRGEDVRARITVLAEIPDVCREAALDELLRLAPVPDLAFGSLLAGRAGRVDARSRSRPPERLHGYAEKAMREAGDPPRGPPRPGYEAAVHAAVDSVFESAEVQQVLAARGPRRRARPVERAGREAAGARCRGARRLPGQRAVETSLVDPDNRRPVDFDHRAAVLAGEEGDDAVDKLHRHLCRPALRRERPDLFTSYARCSPRSRGRPRVAFDRGGAVAVATGCRSAGCRRRAHGDDADALPAGRVARRAGHPGDTWLADLLRDLPVALLVRGDTA